MILSLIVVYLWAGISCATIALAMEEIEIPPWEKLAVIALCVLLWPIIPFVIWLVEYY